MLTVFFVALGVVAGAKREQLLRGSAGPGPLHDYPVGLGNAYVDRLASQHQ